MESVGTTTEGERPSETRFRDIITKHYTRKAKGYSVHAWVGPALVPLARVAPVERLPRVVAVLSTGQPGQEPAKAASAMSGCGRLTRVRGCRRRGRRRRWCRGSLLLLIGSRIRGWLGRGRDARQVGGGWLGYWWHLYERCLGWALLESGWRVRSRCRCRPTQGLSSLACVEIDRPRGRRVVGAFDVD